MSLKKAVAIGAMASTLTLNAFVNKIEINNQEKYSILKQSNIMQNFESKYFFTEEDEKFVLSIFDIVKELNQQKLNYFDFLETKINNWKIQEPMHLNSRLEEDIKSSKRFIKLFVKYRKLDILKDNKKIMKTLKELEESELEILNRAKIFKEQIKRNVKIANMLNEIMDENDELFKALS